MTEVRDEDCQCETCGNTFQGQVTVFNRFKPPRESRQRECLKCRDERKAREKEEEDERAELARQELRGKWRRACGMPPEALSKTFDNFEVKYQKVAYTMAHSWAKDFDLESPAGYPSLVLYSDIPGTGKGHLMSSIVNYAIENWKGDPGKRGCPIRFESGPSLVRRIRATYNIRSQDDVHEREDEVYRSMAGYPLLLLDDVGKESPSNFTRETYWYIIDERVKSGLPVVISTRLEWEGTRSLTTLMGEDTVSRLYGMSRGEFVILQGLDYRKLKAVP